MDWSEGHRHGECHVYKKAVDINSRLVTDQTDNCALRMALRLYLKSQKDPESLAKQFKLHDGNSRSPKDLMDHKEELMKTSDAHLAFEELNIGCSKEQFYSYFGKTPVNGFQIKDDVSDEYFGCGLFIEASIFDHSCLPNAYQVTNGLKIIIRALDTIKEGDEIHLSYINPKLMLPVRKSKLKKFYFFECKCKRCSAGPEEENQIYGQLVEFSNELDGLKNQSPSLELLEKVIGINLKQLDLNELLFGRIHTEVTKVLINICTHISMLLKMKSIDLKEDQEFNQYLKRLDQSVMVSSKDGTLNQQYLILRSSFFQ